MERLLPLQRLAEAAGLDFPALSNDQGLADPNAPGADTSRIRLTDYYRMVQSLSLELQDETCHLSSRPLIPGSSHFIWSHVVGAENLYEAMQRVAGAYNLLHGGRYNHVEMDAGSVRYLIDDRKFPYVTPDNDEHVVFSLECVLIFLHCTLAMISPPLSGMLTRVYSRRERIGDGHHLRFLNVPIHRNRKQYGLAYRPEAAWLEVTATRESLPKVGAVYDRIIEWIERDETPGKLAPPVSEDVRDLLESGLDSQRAVAERLGISVATLRRRLSDEGVTFRRLRTERLQHNALTMLRQGMRPAEVAEALGYSDTRSFNRAFLTWRGLTPARFRQTAGAAGDPG
ncbi:MAG: helix-turn-helix domain-containing protein [Wenzhouxiangellaceae bacterium]|nr:helix-turn-helix domain-containing protein [Wenzhouxiangellaceae bacterium]